jgi:hypothetical protein
LAAAGLALTGALFSGVAAGGGGAFAFALATLSSRFAFALAVSLAFDEEESLSTADFWPCDLAAAVAADLLLSLTALAVAASVVLELAADFCGSEEPDWGGLLTTAVVGTAAGCEATGPDPGVAAGNGGWATG